MLNSDSFKPAEWAVIETETIPEIEADTTAQVEVTDYEANKITLTTQRSTPGFLVLSEIWYPAGWQATIDGEQTEIFKTNFVLRGVQVPAGQHGITFTFEPVTVYWGNLFSWVGHALLLLIGIGAVFVTYRRKNKPDTRV